MYKDKDKQAQAQREAAKRYRAKGMTQEKTHTLGAGMTIEDVSASKHEVVDSAEVRTIAKASSPDTQRIWDLHQAQHRPMTYPHKFNDKISLALPGEPGYEGVCYKDLAASQTTPREAGVWKC